MRFRTGFAAAVIALAALFLAPQAQAQAEHRIALVIGNAAYKDAPLKNPVNDARAMAARLRQLGFQVVARENATRQQMAGALAEFARKAKPGSAALIYYAGHGIQARGRNYLIPVDATLESETVLRFQAVDLDTLTEELQQAQSRVSFLILDACRNNPFERRVRGGARGLAAIDVASGTLVAYATAPGSVASDGDGDNGVYTAALRKALATPGLKAEEVFKRVRADVATATKNQQTPWESSSLTGDFVFNLTVNVAPSATASGAPTDRETVFWQSAQASNRAEEYEAYLKQYPQGAYAALAQMRVASLKAQPQIAAAPTPPPAVTLEPIDKEYVATQTARLREQPDVKSKQIGQVKEGDTLLVLGKVKGQPWYQVEPKGETPGFVSAGLLEEAAAYKKHRDAETQQAPQQQAMVTPTPGPTGAAPAPGRTFRDCPDCPEMVVVPAGSFTMGSPQSEVHRGDDEGPQHSVSVRSFALGKYEVTRGEFASFLRETGYSAGGGCYGDTGNKWEQSASRDWRSPGIPQSERDPVVCVNWDDAKAYVAWLSRKSGKSYRLPSESEWEYASRAGTTAARHWGEDESQACGYANVGDRTGKQRYPSWTIHECDDGQVHTAPVGTYRANGFGLNDMLGNVWEWTEDCWNKSYDGSPRDGSAWTSGECGSRVLRGGSWGDVPEYVRSAVRLRNLPTSRYNSFGFRVARTF